MQYTKFLRLVVLTGFIAVTLLFPTSDVMAAKKRVRKATVRARGVSYSTARLNRPSRSAIITFINLGNVQAIEYELEYSANGIPQGVMGSFAPAGSGTTTRDLYFGTCSKGVCTPHYGITNATLIVTTTLKSGATNTKRYRFKNV